MVRLACDLRPVINRLLCRWWEGERRRIMDETQIEIDQFERRLELKTVQEGLKHKAASSEFAPSLVYNASRVTVDDFTHRMTLPPINNLSPTLEEGAASPDIAAYPQEQDKILPEAQAPPPRGVPYAKEVVVPVVVGRELVVKLLHAASLEGPEIPWKKGKGSGPALLCNPLCMLRYGCEFTQGKVIKGSRNPVWKDSFTFQAPSQGPFGKVSIDVVNFEGGGKPNTLIGQAELEIDSFEGLGPETPVQKWFELKGGRGGRVHCEVCVVHKHEEGSS